MKKRLLALLLCLVMVIGLVPTVLAVDPEQTTPVVDTYTVHFVLHGGTLNGSNSIADASAALGGLISDPGEPRRDGYDFGGWYMNETYAEGAKWDFATSTVSVGAAENDRQRWLHAKWTPKPATYTVTLVNSLNPQESHVVNVYDDGACTLPAFTSLGWTVHADKEFSYWQENGSWFFCADKYRLTGIDSNKTLTAVYNDKEKTDATITYKDRDYAGDENFEVLISAGDVVYIDPNGGVAKLGNKEIRVAGNYKVESKMLDNQGKIHLTEPEGSLGWTFKSKSDTNPYSFVAVWPSTKTVTISYLDYYYGADTETIKYDGSIIVDPNGGSVVWGRTTISSKQTIENIRTDAALARATRNGYTFYGWVVSYTQAGTPVFTATWSKDYYYNTYSIYYYDFEDGKSEYANFPYGTSIVIDPNGGTAKLSGTSFSTKQYFNIYRDYTLTDASRSGYTFYGWDLTKSGSTYYFTAMWSRYKSDVPYTLNGTDHYAYIKGYPNGSFKPTDTITRAEAATIFYRLLTDSTRKAYATTYNSFKDVPATAWYNTAVSTMAKLGIVNGGADGYFRPNDPITRAEIAAMIARCDGAYYTGSSTVFSDTYGHWAASYIARAYELGWINGYGTTYAPDRYISRAETVAVLNRVLNRAPQYTSDLTRNYTTFSDVATSAWYYLDVEEAANSHTYTRKSNADYETWTKLIADPSWF